MGVARVSREQAFRQWITNLTQLRPGEHVLDVGYGTGTLAMETQSRVGKTGHMPGINWLRYEDLPDVFIDFNVSLFPGHVQVWHRPHTPCDPRCDHVRGSCQKMPFRLY